MHSIRSVGVEDRSSRQRATRLSNFSHRLAIEDVLDVRDGASRLDRRAGKDVEALLRCVQHLLDIGKNSRSVLGDERVLQQTAISIGKLW